MVSCSLRQQASSTMVFGKRRRARLCKTYLKTVSGAEWL
ncbi:hypothetical protein VPHD505_0049 [Vibrio phage D505]